MINSTIGKTEFDFIVGIRQEWCDTAQCHINRFDTIKLYTMQYITAKLKWQLDKLFVPAVKIEALKKMNTDGKLNLIAMQGIDVSKIAENTNKESVSQFVEQYSEIMLAEISKSPLEQINDNYDQSVNFCMLCVDRQRMLAQENGRELLDKVLDVNYWDMQTPELVSSIIAQYSPSISETA